MQLRHKLPAHSCQCYSDMLGCGADGNGYHQSCVTQCGVIGSGSLSKCAERLPSSPRGEAGQENRASIQGIAGALYTATNNTVITVAVVI